MLLLYLKYINCPIQLILNCFRQNRVLSHPYGQTKKRELKNYALTERLWSDELFKFKF